MKKLLFTLLVSSLAVTGRAEEKFKLLSLEDSKPQMGMPEIVLAIGVTVAGLTVAIVLRHKCQQWFGTNQGPAQTNRFKVERSSISGTNWLQVGLVTSTAQQFEYRETNSVMDHGYKWRVTPSQEDYR